jgi:hypothetical protein
VRSARQRRWTSEEFSGPAVLALALLALLLATLIDANGFVAAFVAGSAFGALTARGEEREVYYVEQTCGLASMILLAPLRGLGGPGHRDRLGLAHRPLRRAEPDGDPYPAGGDLIAGRPNGLVDGVLHRLVRAAGTGFNRLRPHRAGRAARAARADR